MDKEWEKLLATPEDEQEANDASLNSSSTATTESSQTPALFIQERRCLPISSPSPALASQLIPIGSIINNNDPTFLK